MQWTSVVLCAVVAALATPSMETLEKTGVAKHEENLAEPEDVFLTKSVAIADEVVTFMLFPTTETSPFMGNFEEITVSPTSGESDDIEEMSAVENEKATYKEHDTSTVSRLQQPEIQDDNGKPEHFFQQEPPKPAEILSQEPTESPEKGTVDDVKTSEISLTEMPKSLEGVPGFKQKEENPTETENERQISHEPDQKTSSLTTEVLQTTDVPEGFFLPSALISEVTTKSPEVKGKDRTASVNRLPAEDDLKQPEISEIRAFVNGNLIWTSEEEQKAEYPNIQVVTTVQQTDENINNSTVEVPEGLENWSGYIKEEKHCAEFDWSTNDQSAGVEDVSRNELYPLGPPVESFEPFSNLPAFRQVLADFPTKVIPGPVGVERPDGPSMSQLGPPKPPLSFEPVPEGDAYEMETMAITDGVFVFAYLGQFLSFIQPYDFPVEFLRDVLWNRLSIVSLIFQSLRVEAGFVTCVVVGVLLSLVIPSLTLAATCSNLCVPAKSLVDSASMNGRHSVSCTRKTLVFGLFLIVVMIGGGVTAMLVTNEQLSSAMLRSPRVLSAALNDASVFVRNTQRQLHHVTLGALDRALGYLYGDLDGVEQLLGKPIQKQIASETGVDVALDALVDVATVTDSLSKKVAELQETNLKMRELTSEARDRLVDLRHQVDSLRRACPSRDRPLCDTVESSGLDISIRTDMLNTDARLATFRSMAGGNLLMLAQRVRSRFADIPSDVGSATRDIREDIRRELERQRSSLDATMWPMETLTRDLRVRVSEAKELANIVEDAVQGVEQWRWLSLLATAFLVLLIWIFLTSALIYTCCDKEGKSRSLLITVVVLSSIFSIVLWAVALSLLLVGGHGEVFVCRPLYDEPDYKSLTELLDDPGVLYQRGGGFFKNLLPNNQSLNVPIRTVLQECEENRPAYEAFRLNTVLNIEAATDFKTWANVFNQLENLNGNFTQLRFLDPELQDKLQNLLQAAGVNMTAHRMQISRPVTGKDLNSFAKQLDSVANQIKDLATASRVETLASRTRRLISTNIQPLEKKKEELVYQVTALEVQIGPLQRQVNQTMSHLKTIQFYINNQGANISFMKAADYSRRLTGYLSQYRGQLMTSLTSTVAPCRPIFDLFHGVRHHVCRMIMDPLNGFWFGLVWCLLALVIVTPVSLNLIYYYGLQQDGLLDSTSGSVNSAERGGPWNTPGSEESGDNW